MTGARPAPRMTPGVQAIFHRGFEHAVRLGHRHLGCEHLLLAVVEADHPVAIGLRAHGLRPDSVTGQILRVDGDGLFGDLDADSLTAIGIDLDAVRERALASFGPEALARAGRAGRTGRAGRRVLPVVRSQPGAWHGDMFLPHSPDLGELLGWAHQAGLLEPTAPLDVPQLAVGLLSVTGGPVPPMLAALGVDAAAARAAVTETGEPGGA
jgi:hypothetical protein